MATTAQIADAINSIPERKEKLRKTFETLKSHSSALFSFTLQWQDLEDHFNAIESSINAQFKALQSQPPPPTPTTTPLVDKPNPNPTAAQNSEPKPRPELKSLCVAMNAKELCSFISANREDLNAIRNELIAAVRCAPDPAELVLDAMDGFYDSNSASVPKSRSKSKKESREGDSQVGKRICIDLLETVYMISPEIKKDLKEKAKQLAVEWKGKVSTVGDSALEIMGFLQLIASYGLVSEFGLDEIMELFVSISRRKQAIDLVKNLGLVDKLPDLIEKLNSNGRQLDAVKFVFAFNLTNKFPPVPLLKAYIAKTKKIAQEVLKEGNNSLKAQNEAIAKEVGAINSVLKAIEEYKLESEYPREQLEKRITQLEKKKEDKKRTAPAPPASGSKNHQANSQQQQQHRPNKRPRQSLGPSASAIAANAYRPLLHTQPPHGLGGEPYMGIRGPYGLPPTSSLYGPAGPSLHGPPVGHGGIQSPPRPYAYTVDSLAGQSSLYRQPGTYSGYPTSRSLYP